jgi:hypothetical protein
VVGRWAWNSEDLTRITQPGIDRIISAVGGLSGSNQVAKCDGDFGPAGVPTTGVAAVAGAARC